MQVCSDTDQGAYSFLCPTCACRVSKPAEARIVDLLVSSGVRLELWSLPAELAERKAGPAITYDDVLEFHFLLQQPDLLARIAEATASGS